MRGKKLTNKEIKAKLQQCKNMRKQVFKELLRHVDQGYSLDCFPPISETYIKELMTAFPEEFCLDELKDAMRRGKVYWEDIGHRQAQGTCLGNSRTWYYNMANRYGWREKLEVEAEHKGTVNVNVVSYATAKASQDKREKE